MLEGVPDNKLDGVPNALGWRLGHCNFAIFPRESRDKNKPGIVSGDVVTLTRRAEMSNALTSVSQVGHLTLRCTADVFPRFSSISYSICCPSLSVFSPGRHCGDVDEHVLAATLRLNESVALGRIEPLDRAARHCRSPIDGAQILFWICSLAAKRAAELCTSRRSPTANITPKHDATVTSGVTGKVG